MSRRAARRSAVEVLYAAEVRGQEPTSVLDDRDEPADPYTEELVKGVDERRGEIDALLEANAIDWPLARMNAVDRNTLRVAVYELATKATTAATAIDEAVRIAKRMSGDEAARFVNGVLSGVLRQLQASGRSDD